MEVFGVIFLLLMKELLFFSLRNSLGLLINIDWFQPYKRIFPELLGLNEKMVVGKFLDLKSPKRHSLVTVV